VQPECHGLPLEGAQLFDNGFLSQPPGARCGIRCATQTRARCFSHFAEPLARLSISLASASMVHSCRRVHFRRCAHRTGAQCRPVIRCAQWSICSAIEQGARRSRLSGGRGRARCATTVARNMSHGAGGGASAAAGDAVPNRTWQDSFAEEPNSERSDRTDDAMFAIVPSTVPTSQRLGLWSGGSHERSQSPLVRRDASPAAARHPTKLVPFGWRSARAGQTVQPWIPALRRLCQQGHGGRLAWFGKHSRLRKDFTFDELRRYSDVWCGKAGGSGTWPATASSFSIACRILLRLPGILNWAPWPSPVLAVHGRRARGPPGDATPVAVSPTARHVENGASVRARLPALSWVIITTQAGRRAHAGRR